MSNLTQNKAEVSIIIPTYNEAENIVQVLKSIDEYLPKNIVVEAIVVDDNSPDGTGKVVENYINDAQNETGYSINVLHRKTKSGLSSAILDGIQRSSSEIVVVMDSDFSHPPKIIPQLVEEIRISDYDIVIASRYTEGGEVSGWSTKRKIISKGATGIAKAGLGVNESDPMSGFFAFKRKILEGIKFDAIGYKNAFGNFSKDKRCKSERDSLHVYR